MFTWNLTVVESDKQGATDKLASGLSAANCWCVHIYSSPSPSGKVIAGKRTKTGETVACGQF